MTDATTHDTATMNTRTSGKVRVWDPLVRVFHWGLVAAFATAWLTADELQPVHEIAGYAVAGLVAFRLIWGLVGSRYARFAQFLKGPRDTLAYLGDRRQARTGIRRHHLSTPKLGPTGQSRPSLRPDLAPPSPAGLLSVERRFSS